MNKEIILNETEKCFEFKNEFRKINFFILLPLLSFWFSNSYYSSLMVGKWLKCF
jgi:hypothetical protein